MVRSVAKALSGCTLKRFWPVVYKSAGMPASGSDGLPSLPMMRMRPLRSPRRMRPSGRNWNAAPFNPSANVCTVNASVFAGAGARV